MPVLVRKNILRPGLRRNKCEVSPVSDVILNALSVSDRSFNCISINGNKILSVVPSHNIK